MLKLGILLEKFNHVSLRHNLIVLYTVIVMILLRKLLFLLSLLVFSVGACASHASDRYLATNQNVRYLLDHGVRIYENGNRILIILATKLFFDKNSISLNTGKSKIFRSIISYINSLDVDYIKFIGYTDGARKNASKNDDLDIAISQTRAYALARYMRYNGLDVRLSSAVGLGSTSPLSLDDTLDGTSMNGRTEILIKLHDKYDPL